MTGTTAKITLPDGKESTLPVVVGSENEHALDIRALRAQTGYITLDTGYMNTGAVQSAITYLDGEQGTGATTSRSWPRSRPSSRPATC